MNYIKVFFISWLLISLITKSFSKDFGTEEEATNMLENAQSHSPEDTIIGENVRVLTISF